MNIQIDFVVNYFDANTKKQQKCRVKKIEFLRRFDDTLSMKLTTVDNDVFIFPYSDFISAETKATVTHS